MRQGLTGRVCIPYRTIREQGVLELWLDVSVLLTCSSAGWLRVCPQLSAEETGSGRTGSPEKIQGPNSEPPDFCYPRWGNRRAPAFFPAVGKKHIWPEGSRTEAAGAASHTIGPEEA